MGNIGSVLPLEPFGIEVEIDLAGDVRPEDFACLRQLYAEHHLLLFRTQHLSMYDQVRVAKQFGPVTSIDGLNLGTYVSNVRPDGNFGLADVNGELIFHHDGGFTPHPALGILFQAIDVVKRASSTRFASGAVAMERLSPALRERLHGLQTLHTWTLDPSKRNRSADVPPQFPRTIHPVVWRHKVTGKPFLFCCKQTTDSILGLPEEQSEALLQEIWEIGFPEEAVYDHFWEMGDLVLVDNRVLQHARGTIYHAGPRTLQRVTLADIAFADIYPDMNVAAILGSSGEPVVDLSNGYKKDLALS